jgi:ABC-type branched-subunit amino acid transport system substrate-binding protein
MPFSLIRRRAMARLLAIGAAAFALAACDLQVPSLGGGGGNTGSVQVAMLVPSGAGDPQIAALARSLTNSARLAVAEAGAKGVTVDLRVYDTAGSAAQTAEVARRALAEGAQVIVGPLYSQNANAAGLAAAGSGVPVLTFSNTTAVAGGNVLLLGNTFANTANRLVSYARGQGVNRFMVVHGQSAFEDAGRDAIVRAVQSQGGQIATIASFPMSQDGVSSAAPGIAAAARDSGAQAVFLTSDPAAALPFVARALPEAGLSPSTTRYMGLTRWDQPASALALPGLQGGWFAYPDQAASSAFANRYAAAYGSAPTNVISFLGYDGVIAAVTLVQNNAPMTVAGLISQNGFAGGNGTFRFLQDGTNARALAVATVQNNTVRIVDAAPTRLGSAGF